MGTTNTSPELALEFTLAPHHAALARTTVAAATRAFAVIAMQNVNDEPTDAAPIPPLEIISMAEDADDLRSLAELFTILADATRHAADQMEAQGAAGKEA